MCLQLYISSIFTSVRKLDIYIISNFQQNDWYSPAVIIRGTDCFCWTISLLYAEYLVTNKGFLNWLVSTFSFWIFNSFLGEFFCFDFGECTLWVLFKFSSFCINTSLALSWFLLPSFIVFFRLFFGLYALLSTDLLVSKYSIFFKKLLWDTFALLLLFCTFAVKSPLLNKKFN